MPINVIDAGSALEPLKGVRETRDGFLVAEAFAVRTGVQDYLGSEVGRPDMAVVRVYRAEDEVRAPDSLRTFSHATVTVDHPPAGVTPDTYQALSVGEVSTEAEWVDGRIRLPLIIKDAAAIAAVRDGSKRELSAGYSCDLDWTPGVTADGQPYDAQQKNIRINHLALVARGRAGNCGIGMSDADPWGIVPVTQSDNKEDRMSDALSTLVLGDEAVQVAATDAAKITKWKADQAKALTDAQAAHDKALAAKDADLAKKDAEIADLKGKVLSDADLDARVQARADLVGKARALVKDFDPAGKSDADIRKAVVVAKRGAAMADKSAAYIDAAFDLLAEDAGKTTQDPIRQRIAAGDTAKVNDEADAWAANLADLNRKPKEG